MPQCPTCGRTDVDAAGYCQGCGTYRGTPGYDAGGQYGSYQTSAPPHGGPASGAPYGTPASGVPYGTPASGAPYGTPASGAPYGGPAGGAGYGQQPPYGGQYGAAPQPDPYQQAQYGAGGYTDPNYPTPSFVAPDQQRSRRPSAIPLIALSVVAVILVVGIVAVVIVKAGNSGGGGSDDPTTASSGTAAASNPVAAGLDSCVVGKWRVSSAREKVDLDGELVEFNASGGGGSIDFRGDGTGTYDYGSGVDYRGTIEGQAVTITFTGNVTFSYKTVDNAVTYSNPKSTGEAVVKINGVTTTSIPLDMDTTPNSYACSSSSMSLTTALTTIELRK